MELQNCAWRVYPSFLPAALEVLTFMAALAPVLLQQHVCLVAPAMMLEAAREVERVEDILTAELSNTGNGRSSMANVRPGVNLTPACDKQATWRSFMRCQHASESSTYSSTDLGIEQLYVCAQGCAIQRQGSHISLAPNSYKVLCCVQLLRRRFGQRGLGGCAPWSTHLCTWGSIQGLLTLPEKEAEFLERLGERNVQCTAAWLRLTGTVSATGL